ncbi:MAG: hypothetical protein ACYTEQ_01035 [Planctomycetota bacterium]|jgi:hypothetical protein
MMVALAFVIMGLIGCLIILTQRVEILEDDMRRRRAADLQSKDDKEKR